MGALSTIAPKLGKLLPRLASDHDGEVVATARAIGRTLSAAGLDFHALAAAVAVPPIIVATAPRKRTKAKSQKPSAARNSQWRDLASLCLRHRFLLNEGQLGFVENMAALLAAGHQPSMAQAQWLKDIADRITRETMAAGAA